MNIQDNNPIHHVLSARLIETQITIVTNIIHPGRPSHDYSISSNKTEVSRMWKRECEIQAVFYHHRRMAGQDCGSPDSEDLGKEMCGVWA
jgi:hypothetical protein